MTRDEWDIEWSAAYDEARAAARDVDSACEVADDVTTERLGPRPEVGS